MSDRPEQVREELWVFRRFAELGPLAIGVESIQKRPEPEPDVRCLERGQPLAFELVNVLDSGFKRRFEYALDLGRKFPREVDARAPQLRRRLPCTWIRWTLRDDSSAQLRRAALPELIELLLRVSPEFKGRPQLDPNSRLARASRSVEISRGEAAGGPHLHVSNAGSFAEPLVERVGDKFNRKYKTDAPLELLAYYDLQPLLRRERWIDDFKLLLLKLESSPFRRVWIFHVRRGVVFVWPPLDGLTDSGP